MDAARNHLEIRPASLPTRTNEKLIQSFTGHRLEEWRRSWGWIPSPAAGNFGEALTEEEEYRCCCFFASVDSKNYLGRVTDRERHRYFGAELVLWILHRCEAPSCLLLAEFCHLFLAEFSYCCYCLLNFPTDCSLIRTETYRSLPQLRFCCLLHIRILTLLVFLLQLNLIIKMGILVLCISNLAIVYVVNVGIIDDENI